MIQLEVTSPSTSPSVKLLSLASGVPIGTSGLVHVWGRNDMVTPQEMGISWVVKDPDGDVVEEHTDDWAGWPWPTDVDPNDTHEFIGGRFDINKPGTWTISIWLWMVSASPVMVDSYEGVLCVVKPVEGTIIRKELEYSGSGDGIVPVSDVPLGVRAKLHVWGKNLMSISQGMGIYWFVADPDGMIAEEYTDWGGTIGAGQDHEFISSGQFDLNKVGKYTTWIELLMGTQDNPQIVDRYIGDLCTVTTEAPPEFDLIQHTIYPYAYIYDGDVEVTIATFKTDPFTPAAWMGDKFASKLEEEVRARGGRPIEVKVYTDTTPLFWTNFRVEVVGTPLGAGVASGIAVGIPIWLAIILVCLAIIAVIVVVTLAITTITESLQHKPGLHEVKLGWGKETLMLTIHDSEEYWERPLTPTETLEGMSEAELRDYLDQIAEEEVAPEVSWWPLAIVAGVVVVGGGAAIALTAGRK
ncbi:hypothetical protein ES703_08398 [subsurface metagenome]